MTATVGDVEYDGGSEALVSLLSPYGTVIGRWASDLPPDVGAVVHVELELEPPHAISVVEQKVFIAVSPEPEAYQLVGVAEGWADGVLSLRVGDALVMLETDILPELGAWLRVVGYGVQIFSMEL